MTTGRFWPLAVAVLLASACAGLPTPSSNAPTAQPSKLPSLPTSPIELNVLDVAGGQVLTQGMFDDYKAANPNLVSKVTISKATAPELAAKIKAQQQGGSVQYDVVLTGNDGLAAGVAQNLWVREMPNYSQKFPNLEQNYLPAANKMWKLANGYGILYTYTQSGPLLEYNPAKVPTPPASPQELLDWARTHPGRFEYARPANSGPGRTMLQGLPYLLGDRDPKDPVNGWDKTWAFYKELDKYVDYYPTGTSTTMKDIANGTRDMIASTMGWDINPRVLGTVPNTVKTTLLQQKDFHFMSDSQYMVIPNGVSDEHLAVALDFLAFMLKPKEQAITFDDGYFYPGPAVRGVTIGQAPAKSQAEIQQFGRPEYNDWISRYPAETALEYDKLNAAFEKWDKEVGGSKIHA